MVLQMDTPFAIISALKCGAFGFLRKASAKEPRQKRIKTMDINSVIKHPLSTEKSIRMMESENKLLFVVDRRARKSEIKEAVEKLFKAKVRSVNTLVSQKGEKRAYVMFSEETPAIDIATKLGLM